MRHNKKGRKLGTDYSHTKAMKRSLVSALFLNDRIKTVESRAKEIRPQVDKVITWAKRGDLHSRRLAIAYLNDKELVREIFEKVAQGMFQDRPGGYTRIMKLGPRKGDNAPMVIMELVTEPCVPKAERKAAAEKKAAAKKAAPKKVAKKADKSEELAEDLGFEADGTVEQIEDLDLSVRSYNCLKRAGIHSVRQLVEFSENDLLNIRNFGAKSIEEVKDKLISMDLNLKL